MAGRAGKWPAQHGLKVIWCTWLAISLGLLHRSSERHNCAYHCSLDAATLNGARGCLRFKKYPIASLVVTAPCRNVTFPWEVSVRNYICLRIEVGLVPCWIEIYNCLANSACYSSNNTQDRNGKLFSNEHHLEIFVFDLTEFQSCLRTDDNHEGISNQRPRNVKISQKQRSLT